MTTPTVTPARGPLSHVSPCTQRGVDHVSRRASRTKADSEPRNMRLARPLAPMTQRVDSLG
jgi:hypothetical protein